MKYFVRRTVDHDHAWIRELITQRWGDEFFVVHGTMYYPHELPGFVAHDEEGQLLGLATYVIENLACELVTFDSLREGRGVGSSLLDAVKHEGIRAQCTRLWCITTNDNLPALRFYQKRGFSIIAVHAKAVEQSRLLKPTIPYTGFGGIPIQDEIELEAKLTPNERRQGQ